MNLALRQRRLALAAGSLALATAAAATAVLLASPWVGAKDDANPSQRDVIVHLFQWPWASVASECTNILGPKGFGGVQVSPPQEHVVLPGLNYPWWQDYQPVSYQLVSRRGDRAAFAAMVQACHAAGVRVYVDAVINHMAGGASTGPGSNGSTYTQYDYPSVPYDYNDFHHCGRHGDDNIRTWHDRWEVQNCELLDLSDLATESEHVRSKLVGYLNDLISLGVDGFRVDAAKHIPVADLEAIYSQLNGDPYIYHEVIEGGFGEISPSEYVGIGDVTEFRYGDAVGNAFRDGHLSNLSNIPSQMLLSSGDAMAFVDNHDTQRNGRARLTYQDGTNYVLATAFMLAYPYGTPVVMSSFTFTNPEAGPPATSNGTTTPVSCGSGWECEHRIRAIANLVEFHNTVAGTPVTQWWTNGNNQIAFGRGNNGYVVFNRDGTPLTRTFQTSLPAGTYCDVANGDFTGGACTGPTVTVNGSGLFTATVPANGMLALHVNAKVGGPAPTSGTSCATVATTFSVTAPTSPGETIKVTGNQAALANWNTNNAVPLTNSNGVWSATVTLPANTAVEYKYVRVTSSGSVTWEYDPNRSRTTPTTCATTWTDTWNGPGASGCSTVEVSFAATVTTVWGENVFVLGNRPELSNWDTGGGLALSAATYPVWRGMVTLPANTTFEYKYVKKNGFWVGWESGGNRVVNTGSACALTLTDVWRS
ncbi:MAG: alpha amylase C-terminal domain-containing protein [Micromonosporaceae bacterium]|nr:alpha amylase C-terminal domain-containing protein [Micromonosporaceae bacterium]